MPIDDTPVSPCVRNCCLDLQDICLGCGRKLEEISGWYTYSDEEKREVLRNCVKRKKERGDLFS